jgi:hypothetical protein
MNTIFKYYRLQIIISISLTVVLISQVFKNGYLDLSLIVLGTLLGTFFLDLDYFIQAYFIDPESEFSRLLKDYVKHKDVVGALNYIIYHSNDVKNKTLNSAIFQIALSVFAIYVVRSPVAHFYKALIISVLLNSIYRFVYFYLQNEYEDWFWFFKEKPGKIFIISYNLAVLFLVGLSIYLYK